MKQVQVFSPATVANLVCGFDVLGLCLHEPYDIMDVTLLDESKIIVRSADGYPLPEDPDTKYRWCTTHRNAKRSRGQYRF